MTAEATGAREALLHACADLNCDGETEASALVREFADKHYPAPAPRKVRAEWEADGNRASWADTTVSLQDVGAGECVVLFRHQLRELAALDARADAEGMVEEDGPATCSGRYGVVDASPSAAPAPAPSASPEADGGSFTFTVSTPPVKRAVLLDGEQWVPKSELVRVQRERDEAVKLADMRKEALAEVRARNVQLRAEVQRMELVRDDALRREQSLRAERAAALDRARVAEQRIENGDECWHFTSPSRDVYYPYNVSSSDPLGRCTRGRFVADTENGQ